MYNTKINLQMFADEGADNPTNGINKNSENGNAESKDAEPNKSETNKNDEKKYSDKDVDAIINKKFAAWEKKQQDAIDEAKKLADMDAQQKVEYERDQLKQELESLKSKETKNEMMSTARKMLAEKNINIPDGLLSSLVSKDAETTKANIDGFTNLFTNAVDSAVKEALKGNPPKKSDSNQPVTKEQIMKIENMVERQKAIKENINLFQ